METQTVCGKCGTALGSDAKFCRACGQAVACPSCGAQVAAGAKFCKACGQAVGQGVVGVRAATPQAADSAPPQKAPPRRKRPLGRRTLGVAGTAVVATIGIGLAAMIVLRGGGEKDADDDEPANAQESTVVVLEDVPGEGATRPHLRLEHPAGAVADVPGGPVVFGDGVDLKRIQVADASPAWDRGGVAWRFESVAGITIADAVTVDLPAAGSPGETVIAQSQLGAWIEIPSEAVSLPNGKPGRRLEVRDIPAPWVVAVATPKAGFAGAAMENEAVRLETLYWTDRAAWQREVEAWLPQAEAVLADHPEGYASLLVQSRTPSDFATDLENALRLLGGARIAMVGSGAMLAGGPFTASLPGTGLTGFQLYVAGIDRLAQLRAEWVLAWKRWVGEGYALDEMLFDSSGTTVEQALESALYAWAPWGVDFTRWLVRTQALPAFDLRVLRPYGELYFTDAVITGAGSESHPEMETAIAAASKPFVAGSVNVIRYLRVYSTWAIESTSWIDTLRSWKESVDDWIEKWEVAAAAVGLLVGTVTPAGFAVTAGLYATGGTDTLVDYLGGLYAEEGDGQAWAEFEVFGDEIGAGLAAPLALAWAESKSPDFHSLLTDEDDAVFELKLEKAEMISKIIDITLTIAAINTDWYMLKDVRAISAGTQGYCPAGDCGVLTSTAIPPIQALAIVEGTLKPEDRDAYPSSGSRLLAWDMQYVGDTKPNLHELFHSSYDRRQDSEWAAVGQLSLNQPKKGPWTGSLGDLPFAPHKPEAGPVSLSYAYRTQPHMQAIRLAIPNATLKTIASEYGLGSSPDFKDYGLRLVLKAADGTRNVFTLEEAAQARPGDKKDTTYVTVQLTRDEFEPDEAVLESLPDGYAGARQRMEEGILRTRLTATISALADQTDRLTYAIDFTKPPSRLVQADPQDPASPRVHLYDAAGVEGAALFVGTTSQDRPIEILVDFAGKTWAVQRWGFAEYSEKLPTGGTCGNEEAVIGLAPGLLPSDLAPDELELERFYLSGVLVDNRLARGPLPAAFEGKEVSPYLLEDFGVLNASRTTITNDAAELWFSEIFGCPLRSVSYTATRQ